jgi:hypothetical protein
MRQQQRGNSGSPVQEEEYQRQHQARILAREATLWQQQEELDALIERLDQVYGNIEQRRLKAEKPQARKTCDQIT